MSTETVSKYYLKNGDTDKPKTEVTVTDDQNRLIAIKRKFRLNVDTEITQAQYDTYLAVANQALEDLETTLEDQRSDLKTLRESLETSIISKLVAGTPLTTEEAEYLVKAKLTLGT